MKVDLYLGKPYQTIPYEGHLNLENEALLLEYSTITLYPSLVL
jgi:hypothetical protein